MAFDRRAGRSPISRHVLQNLLVSCIASCLEAAQACTTCASVSIGDESSEDLRECIRVALDCADIGHATSSVLSRFHDDTSVIIDVLQACLTAAERCARECERHAAAQSQCRICAEACRSCQDACQELLDVLD